MKQKQWAAAALSVALLVCSGCSSLLTRSYSDVQPHTSQAWETAGAERSVVSSQEELENAILAMVGRYEETLTLQLQSCEGEAEAEQWVSNAITEVQTHKALGAYAIDYAVFQLARDGDNLLTTVRINYRRTEAEVKNIFYSTSITALEDLLKEAVEKSEPSLVMHITTISEEDKVQVEEIIRDVVLPAEMKGASGEDMWEVNYYPDVDGPVLLEIIIKT